MDGVGGALRPCEVRGCGANGEKGLLFFSSDTSQGKVHARVRAADEQVDFLLVEPFPRTRSCDVRFVLMIREQKLNLFSVDLAACIGNGHADRLNATSAINI